MRMIADELTNARVVQPCGDEDVGVRGLLDVVNW